MINNYHTSHDKIIKKIRTDYREYIRLLQFYLDMLNDFPNFIYIPDLNGYNDFDIPLYYSEGPLHSYRFDIKVHDGLILKYFLVAPYAKNYSEYFPKLRGYREDQSYSAENKGLLHFYDCEKKVEYNFDIKNIINFKELGKYEKIAIDKETDIANNFNQEDFFVIYYSLGANEMDKYMIAPDPQSDNQGENGRQGNYYYLNRINIWELAYSIHQYRKNGDIINVNYILDNAIANPQSEGIIKKYIDEEIAYMSQRLLKTHPSTMILREIKNNKN